MILDKFFFFHKKSLRLLYSVLSTFTNLTQILDFLSTVGFLNLSLASFILSTHLLTSHQAPTYPTEAKVVGTISESPFSNSENLVFI